MYKKKIYLARILLISIIFLSMIPFSTNVGSAASKSKTYEYKQKTDGVQRLTATSSEKADFYVYDGWTNKKKGKAFATYKNKKSIYKELLKLSGTHTIYVVIKTRNGKKASFSCALVRNYDKKSSSSGGCWVSQGYGTGSPTIIYKKMYFSKKNVQDAVDIINNSSLLKAQTTTKNISYLVSTTGLAWKAGAARSILAAAIGANTTVYGIDFREMSKNQLCKACGGTINKNGKITGVKKGVMIEYYFNSGLHHLGIKSWKGDTMYGEKGALGTWYSN